jgi:hypothetical protein
MEICRFLRQGPGRLRNSNSLPLSCREPVRIQRERAVKHEYVFASELRILANFS